MKTKHSQHQFNRYSSFFMLMSLVILLFTAWRIVEYKHYDENRSQPEEFFTPSENRWEKTVEVEVEKKAVPEKKVAKRIINTFKKTEATGKTDNTEEILIDELFPDDTLTLIDDDRIETAFPTDNVPVVDFVDISEAPVFPGCEKYKRNNRKLKACLSKKIARFIRKKFDYTLLEEVNTSGIISVYTTFVIDENGKVTDIQTRSQYKTLAREAENVIARLPQMQPGKQRNKKVKVKYILPIRFKAD